MKAALRPPPDYPRVRDLGGGVRQIDTFHHGHPGTIAVFAVSLPSGGYALVESGPAVCRPAVLAALDEAGLAPEDLRFVLLTHVHLDHAGAAAALASAAEATVYVHRVGAPHVADPGRLMASAGRVYGDKLESLWGRMQPLDPGLVKAVDGDERLDLDGLAVTVLYTPGHASHHVSYLLEDGTLFAGDSAGILLQGAGVIRPALPPPDLDLEAYDASLARMRAARPSRLVLTHFGVVDDPDEHLAAVSERNHAWESEVAHGLTAGEDDAALVRRIERLQDAEIESAGTAPGIAGRVKLTSDAQMTVSGLKRYLTRVRPERVAEIESERRQDALAALARGRDRSFPLGRSARLAVLASGAGSNLAALIAAYPPVADSGGATGALASVVLAVSDVAEAPALARAQEAGARVQAILWTTRDAFEAALLELLEAERIDLVCLAGFMRLLSPALTRRLTGRILNIHPSLLPAYRGLDALGRALADGVERTGCSVHYVDAGMDTGPVVLQREVAVQVDDTLATLTARVQEQEHLAYPEAVRLVLEGRA